ncbi:hypothetical protein Daesc_003015 [Daldinia eschscholtzii]|uniref:Scaffold protein Nfu/NifU N-terminal domain-containing protein n=1 Tax=Daldinia eschscholtzii TaxID=292717 RepID=A0AAX6MRT8_9PEZI
MTSTQSGSKDRRTSMGDNAFKSNLPAGSESAVRDYKKSPACDLRSALRSSPACAYEFKGVGGISTAQTDITDGFKVTGGSASGHPQVLPPEIQTTFIEYLNPRSTIAPPYPSPLAAQLMNIDGVTSVFYGPDFITVTKSPDANWVHIRPEIFSLITEAITSGQEIVNVSNKEGGEQGQEAAEEDSLSYNENDSEVVGMIKELLETRIRPAIQEDGGDIEFRGFEDGYVRLKLRGACRTCDSSTVTLKNGIEGMLMHYIEEVKGVHQVLDQEEEIAMKEFAKFEEKLRAQKGPDAAPTTPGKDSLDSVPG